MATKARSFDLDVVSISDRENWRARLLRGKASRNGDPGAVLANHANVITALQCAPEWAGVLGFNEFTQRVEAVNPTPWGYSGPWLDVQDCRAAEWLQHECINTGTEVVGQSIQTVAAERKFHPVREYLDALKWDGTKRIDTWLSLYFGVNHTDYAAAVGACWLVSAVARIYQPGCKADHCLILEGEQGIGKSRAVRTLAEPWFTDELADLGSKDAAMQTFGVWIVELAELDAMTRAESSRVKAFMSRSTDRFRPPYGKHVVEVPRQSVFVGTVNQDDYLKDETGGRRFWPVGCTTIRTKELKRDRNQLWAEAVARYLAGAQWWLEEASVTREAQQEQSNRYLADPWDSKIAEWLEGRDSVTAEQVLTVCMEKPIGVVSQADKNRVARSLKALRWERFRARTGNSLEWRYRRKD